MDSEDQNLTDGQLARETLTGSLEAFDLLVRRYEKRLYAFLRTCCRNETDARELTQETFVKAYQALAQFNPAHSFASWLFSIGRNKCVDRFRAATPISDDPFPAPVDEEDPALVLARSETARTVWEWARAQLPEQQYQALWLRYTQDMSIAEIARVLRKTQIHTKVILFRGRQTLGNALRQAATGGGSLTEAWEHIAAGEHCLRPASPNKSTKDLNPHKGALVLRQGAPGGSL